MHDASPRRELSLFDAVSIIVGIVIGSGLYGALGSVALWVPTASALLLVWIVGALFSLTGAMCYAELASAYPADGGDYVFLSHAFGRPLGLLFAWTQLWIVRPATIGIMAFVFGQFASSLQPLGEYSQATYALLAVSTLAFVNALGVKPGKRTQNVFTSAKVLGLLGVIVACLWGGAVEIPGRNTTLPDMPNYALALILVLFAYTGWNEMSYVAAEVREPQRNIPRALLGGTAVVMVIYLAINVAILWAVGLEAMQKSVDLVPDHMRVVFGSAGSRGVSLLICVSTLGAMNGMTLTGSRIYYALGQEHRWFAPLGRWNERRGTPIVSLFVEAGITAAMIVALAGWYGPQANAFEKLINFTGPFFWTAMALTGCSLIRLRQRDAARRTTYRIPLYPVLPLAFIALCLWMAASSVSYAQANWSWEGYWAAGTLLTGIALALAEFAARRRA